MKKYRRILCFIYCCVVMLNLPCVAFASNQDMHRIIGENNGYIVNEYNDLTAKKIKRSYSKADGSPQLFNLSKTNCQLIRQLLLDLGMDEDVVNKYTYSELLSFATADYITTEEAYLIIGEDGVQEYVTEAEAENIVAQSRSSNSSNYSDGILKLIVSYTISGTSNHLFTSTAEWLCLPAVGGSCPESLGVTVKGYTLDSNTMYAWLMTKYQDWTNTEYGPFYDEYHYTTLAHRNLFRGLACGNYEGAVIKFVLPSDEYVNGIPSRIYTKFKEYIQVYGSPEQPELIYNGKVVASHSKTISSLSFNPSIELNVGGGSSGFGIDGGITFNPSFSSEITNRGIPLNFTYTP